MARKGELTLLMEVASTWPWKVSAVLVPVSFLACHLIAAAFASTAAPAGLAGLGPVMVRQGIHAFAALLQYILPLIFMVAAVVSFVKRSRAVTLFDDVRGDPNAHIADLSWQNFEVLVGEGFRHRGFRVTPRGDAGSDGGVDLALSRGDERYLVQCKQWRARQVGVSVVRELYGVMAAERVAGGYVVTSGTFTKGATAFASGRNIELVDGKGLDGLLREGRSSAPGVAELGSPFVSGRVAREDDVVPVCPRCRSTMVVRTAKKGSNVGRSFWGCSQFPKCRQTRVMG